MRQSDHEYEERSFGDIPTSIHVDFNFDLAQYLENSDELAC